MTKIKESIDFEVSQGHDAEVRQMSHLFKHILKQAVALVVCCSSVICVAIGLRLLYNSPDASLYLTVLSCAHVTEILLTLALMWIFTPVVAKAAVNRSTAAGRATSGSKAGLLSARGSTGKVSSSRGSSGGVRRGRGHTIHHLGGTPFFSLFYYPLLSLIISSSLHSPSHAISSDFTLSKSSTNSVLLNVM